MRMRPWSGSSTKIGTALSASFIGLDVYGRSKEGESLATAVPKAVVTNAIYSAIPGGIPTMLAITGATALPSIADGIDRQRNMLDRRKGMMNNSYKENDAQLQALSQGMMRMNQASNQNSMRLATQAQSRYQTY